MCIRDRRDTALTMSAFTIVPFQTLGSPGDSSPDEKPGLAAETPKTSGAWELMLLDPAPTGIGETGSTAVGDIDGDGKQEIVIGGVGALLWYRPTGFEKGLVARGHFHVGVALADIDGDGSKEIVAGREIEKDGTGTGQYAIYWFCLLYTSRCV